MMLVDAAIADPRTAPIACFGLTRVVEDIIAEIPVERIRFRSKRTAVMGVEVSLSDPYDAT